MGLSLRDLNAQENDEATPVGQRLQPETAKLHVQASGTGKARKDAGHPQCGWDHVRDGSKFSMGAYEWVNNMENYRRIQRNWILAHFSTSCQNCNLFGHEVDKSPPFDTKKF